MVIPAFFGGGAAILPQINSCCVKNINHIQHIFWQWSEEYIVDFVLFSTFFKHTWSLGEHTRHSKVIWQKTVNPTVVGDTQAERGQKYQRFDV